MTARIIGGQPVVGTPASGVDPLVSSEWRNGWRDLLAATVGMATFTVPAIAIGTMLGPVTAANGWSRTQYSASFTILLMVQVLASPLAGALIDRFDARRIAIPGLILAGLGLSVLSFALHNLTLWYCLVAVIGLTLSGCGPVAWMPVISAKFDRSRGLAMALGLAGMGLTNFILPPTVILYLQGFGLNHVFLALAATLFPLAMSFFVLLSIVSLLEAKRARDSGQTAVRTVETTLTKPGLEFRDVLRSSLFWRLVIPMMIMNGSSATIVLHFIPMMTDAGVSTLASAAGLGIYGGCQLIGKLTSGPLLDRFSSTTVGCYGLLLACGGFFVLGIAQDQLAIGMIAAAFIGVGAGTELNVATYAASRYFGPKSFGKTCGIVAAGVTAAYAILPLIVAFARDATGTYQMSFFVLAVATGIAALVVARLGSYPDFSIGGSIRHCEDATGVKPA